MAYQVAIKEKDVLEILHITRFILLRRIKEGIYPKPAFNRRNGRFIFTLPWIDICKHNEHELRKAQLEVEKLKAESMEQRRRFERETLRNLA